MASIEASDGYPTRIEDVFGHRGKCNAIRYVYANKERLFGEYLAAEDKVGFLVTLPWVGDITKYHLAKNFGVDCCKPDRHLVRIAAGCQTTPTELCQSLAATSGLRVNTVDYILWRSANLRLL